MSIIDGLIKNSKMQTSLGRYTFDNNDPATKYLLGTINRNQKRRWRKKHTIPCQVLMIFWNWGIQLSPTPPEKGMGIKRFLEALWAFYKNCSEPKTQQAALYLYENTVRLEMMPRYRGKGEIYLKGPKGKRIPMSYLKKLPGTI